MVSDLAIGIDIGGTGIKGALVDLGSGDLAGERVKLPTPPGGRPADILRTTADLLDRITPAGAKTLPLGVCFPTIVKRGHTMSAANVSDEWIGLPAESMFQDALDRELHFVNDADAAGYAEMRFGAAVDAEGLSILTTLGTGIGSAFVYDGMLLPNTELGHMEVDGGQAEKAASYAAMKRDGLDWAEWAARLQRFYRAVEFLFSPDLLIVGGGVSKHHEQFLPLLDLETPIVPAVHRNNAGILGAASLASSF